MNDFKQLSVVSSVAGAILVLGACGKAPTVKQQELGQLTPPAFPSGVEPFALTDGQGVGNFEGSLILWDEGATPSLIQAISEASVGGRRSKASTLSWIQDSYLPAVAAEDAAKKDLAAVNARIARAEARGFASPALKAQTKPVAEQWFDVRLGELAAAGVVSEADRTHASTMFGAYCEAKLFELATSALAHEAFNERPTPNQMCEPYFTARGYFAEATRCGAAAGRVYFDCLWQDGVLKSALLVPELATKTCPGTDVYPNRKAAIEAWVASGLLKAILNDRTVFETTTYADKMTSYVMAAGENISSTGLPAKAEYADLKRCRSAFRRDYALPVERWDAASPYSLRDIAETELIDVPATTYKLLPSSGDVEADKANYEKLARYVRVFGKRFQTVTTEPAASYSDYMFNHKADGTTLEANGKTSECDIVGRAGSQSCANEADPAFKRFAELKLSIVPAADLTEQGRLTNIVSESTALIAASKKEKDGLLVKVKEKTIAGVTAVNAPGSTVFFNGFGVQLLRNVTEAEGITVAFRVKGSERGFIGCIPAGIQTACSVPEALADGSDTFESLTFERSRGKLTLRVRLAPPEAYGFGANARTGEADLRQSFNDLDPSRYAGATLEVEMYANRLDDVLDFFTGDAKILDGDKELFTGSVSGDNFSEAMERLERLSAL